MQQATTSSQNDTLLRIADVERRTALKRSKLYQMIKDGEFPSPIRLSQRSVAWLDTEVNEWIHQRIAITRQEVK